jgi:hypothetical protein
MVAIDNSGHSEYNISNGSGTTLWSMAVNIALDFDDTYTRDPAMWDAFIDMAKERGHDIRIVTFRLSHMTDPALDWLGSKIPVIFTEYTQKRKFTEDIDWWVDIWIDDSPEFIVDKPRTTGANW